MAQTGRFVRYLILSLGVVMTWPSLSAASWDPLFRGAQLFDVGKWEPNAAYRTGGPVQLAAGDLNGDDRPDLVVVNHNDSLPPQVSNTVSVLLHSADPNARSAFLPKANYLTVSKPLAIELADMNLDGNLDAVVRSFTDSVCVMLGNGSGGLGTPGPVAYLGIMSHFWMGRGLVLADVNQDGWIDVLAHGDSQGEAKLAVLLGTGGGALGPPALYDARPPGLGGEESYGMAVGDLTGEGILDVVLGGGGEVSLTLLQGNGFGSFSYLKSLPAPFQVASEIEVVDLNADTIRDIVFGDHGFQVMIGTGGGNFLGPVHYADPNSALPFLQVGDLDLDGKADVVTGIAFRRGNGDGTFGPITNVPTPDPWVGDFLLVDVDQSGRPDLVFGHAGPVWNVDRVHTISVWLDDGAGGFQTDTQTVPFHSTSRYPAVADFDRNGKLDVAVAGSSAIEVGSGNGDGTFVAAGVGAATSPGMIVAGDWNRDGNDDIAFQTGTNISGWWGNGAGVFTPATGFTIVGRNIYRRSVADMNRDGRPDLIVTGTSTVRVATQNPDGTFLDNAGQFIGPVDGLSLAPGDWNRDGKTDVAMATQFGAFLCLGNGDGTLLARVPVTATRSYSDLCAGDFNRDGKLDLALLETLAGQSGLRGIDVALGNGSGGFLMGPSIPTLEQNGIRIESWDVNVDGHTDLIVSGFNDPHWGFTDPDTRHASVEVHLGNGTGQFGPPLGYALGITGGSSPFSALFAAGDFNRDDQPDILSTHGIAARSLLATPPDFGNALAPRVDYAMSSGAQRVVVGDLNRDGIPDVVTSSTTSLVSVRLGTSLGTLGPATSVTQSLPARQVRLADVNRDGKLDLLLARAGLGAPDVLTCMLGNGDGTFGPRIDVVGPPLPVGITNFAVGDMNRDGMLDLVVGRPDVASSFVHILLGNGDGTFPVQTAMVSVPILAIHDIEVIDAGRDGKLDVVVAGGGLYILYGNSAQPLTFPMQIDLGSTTIQSVCAADFDHDGFIDLAASDLSSSVKVAWGAPNPPLPLFSSYVSSATPGSAWDLSAGAAERDGRQFLYLSTRSNQVVLMQPGATPGSFTSAGTYSTPVDPEALALGDLNRDGLFDVFTANSASGTVSVFAPPAGVTTGVTSTPTPRPQARLDQNAPNPFNPETRIRFALPEAGSVQLCVYDVQGRLVAKLIDGAMPAGEHSVPWRGRSTSGAPAASGVYYYRLQTSAGFTDSRRMVLLK